MMSLSDDKQADVIDAFNTASRYLDDILNINNDYFDNMVSQIYPSELQLNKVNTSDTEAAIRLAFVNFYRYYKLRKIFLISFYRRYYDLISKCQVGLKSLLRQGLSEPDFYGDLVYKLKKIVCSDNFSAQFIKIISHYQKIGYIINVLQQTVCLVVNPIRIKGEVGAAGLSPPVKYFTDCSKAVLLLWIFYVFVLSCVCYVFVHVCLYVLPGHLLGKG